MTGQPEQTPQLTAEHSAEPHEAGDRVRVAQDRGRFRWPAGTRAETWSRLDSVLGACGDAANEALGAAAALRTALASDPLHGHPVKAPASGTVYGLVPGPPDRLQNGTADGTQKAVVVAEDGTVQMLYAEQVDLTSLGTLTIERASHVEPTAEGLWTADLTPVGGPTLGPFERRSQALAAEVDWINAHVLS